VKRLAAGVAGVLYGLILMWLCLYATSHIERSGGVAHGCLDSDDCTVLDGLAMTLIVFGPAVVFATMNAVAWSRWSIRTWAARSGLATLVIVTLYGALAL
jgi:hypothetical protein